MIGDMESTLLIDAAYRANFDLPQIPEPDGSYMLNQKFVIPIYKKSAGICTCYSSHTSKALHCPLLSERATQKPTPICLYIRPLYPCKTHMDTIGAYIKHTHRASTVAMSLTGLEVCEVSMRRRTKRQVNAFPQYMCPHSNRPFYKGFGMATRQR